ncbi:MAG: diaminopimelate epimerase [Alcanivoracaceae bacterium]|nr:diaminopimelate epimerase [Alcanivoracaceae bacterium]
MKQTIAFVKMHGIGNDFVLIDNRLQHIKLSTALIRSIADRHTGIGFDQLLLIDESRLRDCDAAYRFFNPDGSEAEQCGNGQRCISKYLSMKSPEKREFCISGLSGLIHSKINTDGLVSVNMGAINAISQLTIDNQLCHHVLFGNPHLVTEQQNIMECNLINLNNELTKAYLQGINFEIVEIISKAEIKIRVSERGTGETLACGSGACAAVAALQNTGQLNNIVKVMLPGGNLVVEYNEIDKNLYLTGAAVHVFTGEISI